jgi:hypothetical protein
MPTPANRSLYARVKTLADRKFLAPTSAYKSAWLVAEYKRRGGTYTGGDRTDSGLGRWFREQWVDLRRPTKTGYEKCGRAKASVSGRYPLCRPLAQARRMDQAAVRRVAAAKQKVKHRGRVTF